MTFEERKERTQIFQIVRRVLPGQFTTNKSLALWWRELPAEVRDAYRAAHAIGGLEIALVRLRDADKLLQAQQSNVENLLGRQAMEPKVVEPDSEVDGAL